MRSFTSALAVVLFASTAFAQQTEAVGRIKLVSGYVLVVRGQTQLQAQAGQTYELGPDLKRFRN